MYEAAVAHFQATGKRTLLEWRSRTPTLSAETSGPASPEPAGPPGDRNRAGQTLPRYRGPEVPRPRQVPARFRGRPETHSSTAPITRTTSRSPSRTRRSATPSAAYMYCGMADVAALTGDAEYMRRSTGSGRTSSARSSISPAASAPPRRRGFRRRLRTAQRHGLQRNLRGDRQRALEPPHVPAARRRQVHRRAGTRASTTASSRACRWGATGSSIPIRWHARRTTTQRGSTAPAAR